MIEKELRTIVAHPFLALAREFQWDDRQLEAAKKLIDITTIRLTEGGLVVPHEPQSRLREAAESLVAQFEQIKRHQENLLVRGQTLESACANWDEATLNQSLDFQPLIDAIHAPTDFHRPSPTCPDGELHKLRCIRCEIPAIAAVPPAPSGAPHPCYLIEVAPSGDHYEGGQRTRDAFPTMWYGEDGYAHWTEDAHKAIRFVRREDAETCSKLLGRNNAFVTEHIFGVAAPAPSAPQPETKK